MQKIFFVLLLLILGLTPVLAAECGDVNADNKVTVIDALMCAQFAVGLHPTGFVAEVADVSGDGSVTIVDALQIAQYAVGNLSEFEGCEPTNPTPTPTPVIPETVFAVNCGGSSFTASDGTSFSSDTGFSGGQIYTNTESISGTQDDVLYQSERYGDCTYSAEVPNGYYLVTLYFAETYHTSPGSRVFDVYFEGSREINDLDIYAEAGNGIAYMTENYVTVSDGEITIDFVTEEENAKINAIKVTMAGPAAAFSYSPAIPIKNQTISFDASASSDSNGMIVSYSWTFGDGHTASGERVSHSYSTEDEYDVTLTVVDNDGYAGSLTKVVTVYSGKPNADFTVNPKSPKPGEVVTVDASDSFDPDGTIVSYSWTFGDGGSGTGKTATHTYSADGSYEITLTVTDNQGNTDRESATVMVSSSAAEDSGYDLPVTSPSGSNGGSSNTLPDPFTMWNGQQVKNMEDWRHRRRELVVEVEKRILGEKAPPPAKIGGTVTGSISTSSFSVSVNNPGGSCTFSGSVSLPETGSPPYPAVIMVVSGGMAFTSLNQDVLDSEGVASINFDAYDMSSEASGDFSTGKYFDANPDYRGKTGALVAWAWGVSRIIDMLEKNTGVIDASKIAIHGCSRFGKAAFVIGAFDERIALGLPTEPGTGGPAPLRSLPSLGGQTLSSCIGEASWFGPMAGSYSSSMAVDMSDVAVMYAPRGLLLMDNPHIDHLAYKANYLGCAAAYEVYKAMGEEDAIWYLGNTGNGSHCSVRSEYGAALRAMIRKFLKGDESANTGGLDKSSSHGSVSATSWTSTWKKGTISQ